jgi:RimJ/RimL family protein N-acetyltransferase
MEQKIMLERFQESDFPTLINWINSDRLMAQWGRWCFTFPLTTTQLSEYMRSAQGDNPGRIVFKGLVAETREVIGHIELDRINYNQGTASICRVLVGQPEARGKGFGQSLVQAVLQFAFGDLALRRVDLQVYAFNTSAIACYERVGFKHEGCLRKHYKYGDELWDLVWMGMLSEEWLATKGSA